MPPSRSLLGKAGHEEGSPRRDRSQEIGRRADPARGASDPRVAILDPRVGALVSRVGTVTGRVERFDPRVQSLTDRVGRLEGRVRASDPRVRTAADRVGSSDLRVGSVTSWVGKGACGVGASRGWRGTVQSNRWSPQRRGGGGQPRPLDLRHHSPKVMRANSSLSRLCSSGSRVDSRRSAKAKKRFFSCSRASRPVSMSSTRIRLALVWLDSARDLTRRAVLGGRLTLWRTGFSAVAMA